MLAMIKKDSEVSAPEIKVLDFPVDNATLATLDGWELVEVLDDDHPLYNDENVFYDYDREIGRLGKRNIPGVASGNVQEFQRFLVRWIEESGGWEEDEDAELAVSLIHQLGDWESALNTMDFAVKTDVENGDVEELGRYYYNRWRELCDDGLALRVEEFVNYDALGEDCNDICYGYWCEIYNVWIDWENSR